MEILNALGAAASIGAAIVAVWQAFLAKRYRDEVQSQRTKLLLIDLLFVGRKARAECRKIGTQVSNNSRGVDRQAVLDVIVEFTDRVRDNCHRFQSEKIRAKAGDISQNVTTYANQTEESERRRTADCMHEDICWLLSEMNERLDGQL